MNNIKYYSYIYIVIKTQTLMKKEIKKIETLRAAGVELIDTRSTTGVICAKVNGSTFVEETVAKLYSKVMRKLA